MSPTERRSFYVRTYVLANVESTGSTDLISPARGDSRLFPSTLSVSPIFSEDFTLCTHLLVVSTSLDGVLQLNSGDAIPPEIFSLDQGCHPEASRSARIAILWSRSHTVSHQYCIMCLCVRPGPCKEMGTWLD